MRGLTHTADGWYFKLYINSAYTLQQIGSKTNNKEKTDTHREFDEIERLNDSSYHTTDISITLFQY